MFVEALCFYQVLLSNSTLKQAPQYTVHLAPLPLDSLQVLAHLYTHSLSPHILPLSHPLAYS